MNKAFMELCTHAITGQVKFRAMVGVMGLQDAPKEVLIELSERIGCDITHMMWLGVVKVHGLLTDEMVDQIAVRVYNDAKKEKGAIIEELEASRKARGASPALPKLTAEFHSLIKSCEESYIKTLKDRGEDVEKLPTMQFNAEVTEDLLKRVAAA